MDGTPRRSTYGFFGLVAFATLLAVAGWALYGKL